MWNRRRQCLAAIAGWTAHCSLLTASAWAQSPKPPEVAASGPVILVVGDSLSAEYGLARGSGWVALLAARLAQNKLPHQLVNASISGDTTSGGRNRLPSLLKMHRPALVVLELGGNDALRGLPLNQTRDNLLQMIRSARQAGAKVLLVGMQVPPNYGARYTADFSALFADLAKSEKTGLVPFMLAGIADAPDSDNWFQSDRIHPLAKAHPRILDNIWPALSAQLR